MITSDNSRYIITVNYIAVCCNWQFVWHYKWSTTPNMINWPSGILFLSQSLCTDDLSPVYDIVIALVAAVVVVDVLLFLLSFSFILFSGSFFSVCVFMCL